jgi:hypothetical protein
LLVASERIGPARVGLLMHDARSLQPRARRRGVSARAAHARAWRAVLEVQRRFAFGSSAVASVASALSKAGASLTLCSRCKRSHVRRVAFVAVLSSRLHLCRRHWRAFWVLARFAAAAGLLESTGPRPPGEHERPLIEWYEFGRAAVALGAEW